MDSLTIYSAGSVVSDAEFPKSLSSASPKAQCRISHDLFVNYSTLDIADFKDRPEAIQSQVAAVAAALGYPIDHGIVHLFVQISLLWRRDQDVPMNKIVYSGRKPSWSWMAYTGRINYLVQDEQLEWDRKVMMVSGSLMARPFPFSFC